MDRNLERQLERMQKDEATEHRIYKILARRVRNGPNRALLERIALDELKHYEYWQRLTMKDLPPSRARVLWYVLISRLLGLTFGIKLMERGEDIAQGAYAKLRDIDPRFDEVISDERRHEQELVTLINEERLAYVSSMVLGLNDALVELTGALAGLTLALQNSRLIAIVGLITGIAASMSMAASEYLSTKQEDTQKDPVKASIYTGIAYVLTVCFLIAPYLVIGNALVALGLVLTNAMVIILLFTFYVSVAKDLPFGKRFLEMASISLGIAIINFFVGLLIRKFFGVEA
jgi:VIT1/CCC1 family predicted Fe2+/Mn2+ transporter